MKDWKEFVGKDPNWCPGCGDFGVLRAIHKALAEIDADPAKTVLVTGIGCSGNTTPYVKCFGVHGIHGRALPVGLGIALANPDLHVLVVGGDGDGYGIGAGHFLHAARRNVNLTYLVMDNQVYGLTKGQVSPTSPKKQDTKASPLGGMADAIRPLPLSILAGSGMVAQCSSADQKQLISMLVEGMQRKGFSHINTLSPCVTYNEVLTYDFLKNHTAQVDHDSTDFAAAMKSAMRTDAMPVGVLFRHDGEAYYENQPHKDRVGPALNPAKEYGSFAAKLKGWVESHRC